jgi:hypothetical protein
MTLSGFACVQHAKLRRCSAQLPVVFCGIMLPVIPAASNCERALCHAAGSNADASTLTVAVKADKAALPITNPI